MMNDLKRRVVNLEKDFCSLSRRAADDEGTKIQVELDNLKLSTQAERAQRKDLIQRIERLLTTGLTNTYDENMVLDQIIVAGNALLRLVSRLAVLARNAATFGEDGLFKTVLEDPGEDALRLVNRLEEASGKKPVELASLHPKLTKAKLDIQKAAHVMQDPEASVPTYWYTNFLGLVDKHLASSHATSGRDIDHPENVAKTMCTDTDTQALISDFVVLKEGIRQDIYALAGELHKLKEHHTVFCLLDPGSWTEQKLASHSIKDLRALCKLYGADCTQRGLEKTDLIAVLRPILCNSVKDSPEKKRRVLH